MSCGGFYKFEIRSTEILVVLFINFHATMQKKC